jgi:hypothetical protein
MVALLAFALALSAPINVSPVAADPAIRVRLSDDFFFRGERAKVRFKADHDGYLVVFRMDGAGRIRPLFPLNPEDSSFVRGGREFEVRGRGDRDAFTVDESEGRGQVIAALSEVPFDLHGFTRGSHWDLRALAEVASGDDPELTLLDLIDSLATGKYDYDVAGYAVGGGREHQGYRTRPWFGALHYSDPWYHSYDPFFGSRFRFNFGFVPGRHRGYRRWW